MTDLRCCITEAARLHIKCAMDIRDDETETVDILHTIQNRMQRGSPTEREHGF